MRILLVALVAAAFPWGMHALGQDFYTSFATRVLIYAMAAASLNLVLGYGGMVSFGHAAFFGAGAYVVGILSFEGVRSEIAPITSAASAATATASGHASHRLVTPSLARMPTMYAPAPKNAAWPKLTMPP